MSYATELEFAHDVAVLGGRTAAGHYRREPAVRTKPDGSFVTEGDWAAEAQIRLRIARTFPDHNVLGEEEGLTSAGGGPAVPGAPTWVVDPIDGTNNYIAGIPVWATLLALMVDGESVVGVCHAPALGETYTAARGSGARMNGHPISVDPASSIGAATVLAAGLEGFFELGLGDLYIDVVRRCRRSRGFGDFWGHMLVARGAAHVMLEPDVSTWDYAALQTIVEEAGGRMTQFTGAPCAGGGSCLTTNGVLHEELLRIASPYVV